MTVAMSVRLFGVAVDAVADFFHGGVHTVPTLDLDPFAILEVFVVLEEMLDAGELFAGKIFRLLDVAVRRVNFVDWDRQQLGIAAGFVIHVQYTNGKSTNDGSGLNRARSKPGNIEWSVTIL